MKVVITIPAYNEERTLPLVIKEIKSVMSKTKYKKKFQILVLNDGSSDRTAAVARKAGAKVVSHKRNRGLAVTFSSEMEACRKLKADIIVHTDADGQYPAKYIPELIQKVEEGYELVLGSRFKRHIHANSIVKDVTNRIFALVLSSLLKVKLTDSTTGFRAFTGKVAELPLINTFTYTQEQLIRASKSGFKIGEIAIRSRKTRPSRLFKGALDYAIRAWINILRIYRDYDPIKFFGRIGLVFLLLGFGFGAWITKTWVTTGKVGGIPRVILCALFILTGIQIILFGFLADMFRNDKNK